MHEQIFVREDDIKFEGFLVKESAVLQKWRKRWCVLTSEYLCAFKVKGDYRKPTEFIRLRDCSSVKSAEKDTGREQSFGVVTEERTFFLFASSAAEKIMWMDAIMSCCFIEFITFGTEHSLSSFAIAEEMTEDAKICQADDMIQASNADYIYLGSTGKDATLFQLSPRFLISEDVTEIARICKVDDAVQESNDDCIWSSTDGESGEPPSPYGSKKSAREPCNLLPISAIANDLPEVANLCRVDDLVPESTGDYMWSSTDGENGEPLSPYGWRRSARKRCQLSPISAIADDVPEAPHVCKVVDIVQVSNDDHTWSSTCGEPLSPLSPVSQLTCQWGYRRKRFQLSPISLIAEAATEAGKVSKVVDPVQVSNDEYIWSSTCGEPLSPQSPMSQITCEWGRSRRKRCQLPPISVTVQAATEATEVRKVVDPAQVSNDCTWSSMDGDPLSPQSPMSHLTLNWARTRRRRNRF
mmetsp:Transcript_147575/g.282881  ORF Transcript_147575/g.282881 Transcript_147575/m.282881 type:complete len:468 (+) Transcript_147575:47-1450(+)